MKQRTTKRLVCTLLVGLVAAVSAGLAFGLDLSKVDEVKEEKQQEYQAQVDEFNALKYDVNDYSATEYDKLVDQAVEEMVQADKQAVADGLVTLPPMTKELLLQNLYDITGGPRDIALQEAASPIKSKLGQLATAYVAKVDALRKRVELVNEEDLTSYITEYNALLNEQWWAGA